MKNLFIHNTIFRVIAPMLYGVLVYILLLLINDSVDSLNAAFINQEVLFCIGLTYMTTELFRIQVMILDKYSPIKVNIGSRIVIQVFTGLIISYLLSTLFVSLYFQYVLEYSKYDTEVFTFNIIYAISALLFNLLYISVAYLNMENGARLEEEDIKRKNIEFQMRAFSNDINPKFLYSSLETLIGLLYEDEEDAEIYIEQLSTVYRYILSNKNNELMPVSSEIESSKALLRVFDAKYTNQITFKSDLNEETLKQNMIPGTVNLLIDKIVNMNIISKRQPLKIKCYREEEYLVFQVNLNEKLDQDEHSITNGLIDAYQYFSLLPIIEMKAYGDLFVKIPLLSPVKSHEEISA